MELEPSILWSQYRDPDPCLEPDKSNPNSPILLKMSFSDILVYF
jgi:hypothetical protein